jgi:hypothetical protein
MAIDNNDDITIGLFSDKPKAAPTASNMPLSGRENPLFDNNTIVLGSTGNIPTETIKDILQKVKEEVDKRRQGESTPEESSKLIEHLKERAINMKTSYQDELHASLRHILNNMSAASETDKNLEKGLLRRNLILLKYRMKHGVDVTSRLLDMMDPT